MSTIEIKGVKKRFGDTEVLHGIDLTAQSGEFLVLLGPSGCGKSTMLRLIAGLESVSEGQILIDGVDVTHRPPAERRLSMVFQSYALFPHLNVAENIVFGLKVRKLAAAERKERLDSVAQMVGLDNLLRRRPSELSGGQRQRVALARAIVAQHPICLMDEPLSNLDAKLRHEMRVEIRALQQSLNMTVVYVTHDQTEAMSMADQVMLIRDGRIEQVGTPDDLYTRPATTFTGRFLGAPPMNILTPAGTRWDAREPRKAPVPSVPGMPLLGIRPEEIRLADAGLAVDLVSADYLGADSIITAHDGHQEIVVRTPGRRQIGASETAFLTWDSDAVHIFHPESGRRLEAVTPHHEP